MRPGKAKSSVLSRFGGILLAVLAVNMCPDAVRGGTSPAAPGSPKPGASVGNRAIDFELPNPSNEPVRLSGFRGKVVVVNFWASWCGPCRREVSSLIAMQSRYQADGVEVIGISLDDWWGPAKLYANNVGINYTVLLANSDVLRSYGEVKSVPVSFIIDRDGVIRAKQKGFAPNEFFEGNIRKLLGRK